MANIDIKELLEAGVHFGHMTRKWDPNMAPTFIWNVMVFISSTYIKLRQKLKKLTKLLKKIAASGRKILYRSYQKTSKRYRC